MFKKLIFSLVCVVAVTNNIVAAQTTRSLSGTVNLDVGPSAISREIEITVNNHSFVVLPTFTILRPITSSRSVLVTLPAGASAINYFIDGIISDPVDYSIGLVCVTCSNDFPDQYYSPSGNKFGLVDSTYIDPDDLPSTLNIEAITRASITGKIDLGAAATRDLIFTLSVISAQNPQQIFKTASPLVISKGTNEVSYSVSGLNRAIGSDQYRVKVQCINCFAQSSKAQIFARDLSPLENHNAIDFSVTDLPLVNVAPIVDLILH